MTYIELLNILKKTIKDCPDKGLDHVAFIDVDGFTRNVSHTEFNDGSIVGADFGDLLLMEV
jgi:hypothetical protein